MLFASFHIVSKCSSTSIASNLSPQPSFKHYLFQTPMLIPTMLKKREHHAVPYTMLVQLHLNIISLLHLKMTFSNLNSQWFLVPLTHLCQPNKLPIAMLFNRSTLVVQDRSEACKARSALRIFQHMFLSVSQVRSESYKFQVH